MKLLGAIVSLVVVIATAPAATLEEQARLLTAIQDACAKKDVSAFVAAGGSSEFGPAYARSISNIFRRHNITAVQYEPLNLPEQKALYERRCGLSFSGGYVTVIAAPDICKRIQISWAGGTNKPGALDLYFGEKNGRLVRVEPMQIAVLPPLTPAGSSLWFNGAVGAPRWSGPFSVTNIVFPRAAGQLPAPGGGLGFPVISGLFARFDVHENSVAIEQPR